MQAINAIFDGVDFKPTQPIPVDESYKVVITFLEPMNKVAFRPPFEYECMKDKIRISDDFKEPLEDFAEYS
jgi:hypothetical protein